MAHRFVKWCHEHSLSCCCLVHSGCAEDNQVNIGHTILSNGRMKQRLASASVGAQSQRSRRAFRSAKRLKVKCSTAAVSWVTSLRGGTPNE
jgi:hypothetical protein